MTIQNAQPTRRIETLRQNMNDTPGRMRLLAIALMVFSVSVGLAGAQAFGTAKGAVNRAESSSAQLVRAQVVSTSLAQADAVATATFLVGGLEPPEQRSTYDAAITRAVSTITAAARAQPADEFALKELSVLVAEYIAQVQSARANNRQGLPVGAEYLRQASAQLRMEILPLLREVINANAERAKKEFSLAKKAIIWVALSFPLELVLAAIGLVWLAHRTRRYLNLPALFAQGVLLLAFIASVVLITGLSSTVDEIEAGPYAQTLSLAQARSSAFSAKSSESLGLISRGSGQAFEKSWQESAETVAAELDRLPSARNLNLGPTWANYREEHRKTLALDGEGLWDEAVTKATSATEPSSILFATFDKKSGEELAASSAELTTDLGRAAGGLGLAGWVILALGIAAAALIWRGISRRIEEYR